MERSVLIFGPKHALKSFEREARDAGFQVERQPIHQLSGPVNITEILQLVKDGAEIFAALAGVITLFLRRNPSRRITIAKIDRDKIVALDARGYSKKQLAELLPKCRELIVFEGNPDKKKKRKKSSK